MLAIRYRFQFSRNKQPWFIRFNLYFVDRINDTTILLKSDIDQYEIDQLKMSAAVSSLELFRINQTQSKCGMYFIFLNNLYYLRKLYI